MKRRRMLAVVVASTCLVACVDLPGGNAEKPKIDRPCTEPPGPYVEWGNCQLRGADLKGKDLSKAFIHDVDLSGADLTGVDLSGSRLYRVWAEGAKFRDANLEGASVSGGDIHKGKYCNTTMPDGTTSNPDC